MNEHSSTDGASSTRRTIGLWTATALVVGTVVAGRATPAGRFSVA